MEDEYKKRLHTFRKAMIQYFRVLVISKHISTIEDRQVVLDIVDSLSDNMRCLVRPQQQASNLKLSSILSCVDLTMSEADFIKLSP